MTTEALLRIDAVRQQTGMSRSEIYRRVQTGDFPKPITISGTRSVAWVASEVTRWVHGEIAKARTGVPA